MFFIMRPGSAPSAGRREESRAGAGALRVALGGSATAAEGGAVVDCRPALAAVCRRPCPGLLRRHRRNGAYLVEPSDHTGLSRGMTNFRREGDFSSLGIDQNPVDHPGV